MNASDEILRTTRLILTRVRPSHIPALIDLWTDPGVTRYLGGPREKSSLAADLEKTAQDPWTETYDLWTLVETESGKVVGHCGLLEKDVEGAKEVELVYVLAPQAWGKGYATEIAAAIKTHALEKLGLRRLVSLIDPSNGASERVAKKIGMRPEKEVVRPGGAVRRVYVIGLSSLDEPGCAA